MKCDAGLQSIRDRAAEEKKVLVDARFQQEISIRNLNHSPGLEVSRGDVLQHQLLQA
jgi:hypothetical protein